MIFSPKKIGDYFLYEPSGSGGMGSVYKAVSPRFPGQRLAVKVLSRIARQDAANIHALLNEGRLSARFTGSQFIAYCLDSGYADDEYFTVMPLITGERLDTMIDIKGRIPEKTALNISLHVLAAEQHIYRQGYLYRDLKPENIILNEFGYAVLIDFGLCMPRLLAAQPTEDEFISGSPYYIPPERLLGEGEDASSEIYSLGMVLFYAITGRTFYDADELDSLARRHTATLRVSASAKMQDLRTSVAILIEAMIRKERQSRPQDFIYVADSIKAILQEIG